MNISKCMPSNLEKKAMKSLQSHVVMCREQHMYECYKLESTLLRRLHTESTAT